MFKVKKGSVIKEIDNNSLLADYLSAGWKLVENQKKSEKDNENVNTNNRDRDTVV